ncbi:MAG: trypsin-like serine peptidase [Ktedonobacteraceae bacterium]
MPRQQGFIQLPPIGKILLALLALVYVAYLGAFGRFLYSAVTTSAQPVVEYTVNANANGVINYWTATSMSNATNADQQDSSTDIFTQANLDASAGKSAQQQGQLPRDGSLAYPLSTVGKVFFSNASGQDMVCSGTALASNNHSVVDTAGHCLYWQDQWVQNVIFCPLYENGNTPYGCWAARDLEVPADWISHKPNDLHHDFGMAIVTPNSEGNLTNVVGGAGWAYNQAISSPFYAYGYPAGQPFDGQTRQSCENRVGKAWQHAGGKVISIPCNMTGGSSGGPWFIQVNGNWYLNGHNDFTSSIQNGHMFSPYYDDTWYALYNKAQNT